LRRTSKHRARINRQRRILQEAAWGPRDRWRCWFLDRPAAALMAGACYGEVWGHEILKRSRAGSTDENLLDVDGQVPLCSHHNTFVEDHPDKAAELGLAKHAWE
jgi:hypothetical protein